MNITVFLADDHAVVRDGLKLLLESEPDIKVVGDAADGRSALQQLGRLHPDVAILDIAMPGLNGIEITQQLGQISPGTKVVILSMHSTQEHVFRSLKSGARGYLLKESAGIEVIKAVRSVQAGRRYLSHEISNQVVEGFLQHGKEMMAESPLERLSPREREILQMVVEGKSSAEIAEILFLSAKTVETYRSRLMQKLGISDIPSLVKFAIQHGLTPIK
jgi:DNA-binding NarL/FixJ family response regulator